MHWFFGEFTTSKSHSEIKWPLAARPVLFLFSLFTVIKTPTTHCIHSRIGLCYLSYIRGSLPLLHSYIVDRGGLKEIWARLNIWVWVLISEHFQNGHLHRKIGSSTSLRSAQRCISIISWPVHFWLFNQSCPVHFLTFFISNVIHIEFQIICSFRAHHLGTGLKKKIIFSLEIFGDFMRF